jgi:nucleoside-diphosphate-sugar epimerase
VGHVLIAGCGDLGSALGVRLAGEGHVVWGLRRETKALPTAIRGVEADLAVPNTMRNLPRVDVAVYLGPGEARAFGYFVAALAARKQKLARLFVASGLEVYGDRGGEWVDEDSAIEPKSERGKALAEIESLARDAPWPTTIVRLGELYGPSRLAWLASVLAGEPVAVKGPTAHVSPIHRDDAAQALAHLVSLKKKKPEGLYLFVDRTTVPVIELLGHLEKAAGRPMPALSASPTAPPDVRAMSDRLVETGFRFLYPSFREGYAPLLSRLARR